MWLLALPPVDTPTAKMPTMHRSTRFAMIGLAMVAFSGNSLLSRLALSSGASDAVSFTAVRLISAAVVLALLVQWQKFSSAPAHSAPTAPASKLDAARPAQPPWVPWASALALFAYAAGFSWAYVSMSAATGALILFGAVQLTMVVAGLAQGDRLGAWQWLGFALAMLGMVLLTLPTLSTPSASSALAMLLAGIAWGIYSLLGRSATHPLRSTAANFLRTLPMVFLLLALAYPAYRMSAMGLTYAVIAGALTSGIGYALWYAVLPTLAPSKAAGIQLSVPVLTVVLGALLLQEQVTLSIVLACGAIVSGTLLVLWKKRKADPMNP
jgi:drug/metabolite transporter (DMT)-like permease